jgi:hypothetical protein
MTRDNFAWTLGIIAALFAYLIADGRSPVTWAYLDWIKFGAAAIATISGKLATSPLPHSEDK